MDKSQEQWQQLDEKMCSHPNHFPGALLVYIPPGDVYKHKCPGCGHITEVRGGNTTC